MAQNDNGLEVCEKGTRTDENAPDFRSLIERLLAPGLVLLYFFSFVAKLHEYVNALGAKIVTIVVFTLAMGWTVHAWRAKRMSSVLPPTSIPAFSIKYRILCVILAPVAAIPIWYSFRPVPPFTISSFVIELTNENATDVVVHEAGEFFLTLPDSPGSDTQVAAGVFRLRLPNEKVGQRNKFTVPAKNKLRLVVVFVNASKYRDLYESGDSRLRIVCFQENGEMLSAGGLLFDEETMVKRYVSIKTR